jgi:hypothetical protein
MEAEGRREEDTKEKERIVSELLRYLHTRRLIGKEVDPAHYGGNIESMRRAMKEIHDTLVKYATELDSKGYEGVPVVDEMERTSKDFWIELDLYGRQHSTSLSDDEYRTRVSAFQEKINENRRKLCLKHKLCHKGHCSELC